jgi:hypothetical protein
MVSSRGCAVAAKRGKVKMISARTGERVTDCSGRAKNAQRNIHAKISREIEKPVERISDMKIAIGWLVVSSRSFAASVKDGNKRATSTRIGTKETA